VAVSALAAASPTWANCAVSASTVPFGAYNPASVSATDATGTVTVTCTVLVGIAMSWTVQLSRGVSATYSPRTLANGGKSLSYNLYTTNARTVIWGDGSAGTSVISDSVFLAIGTHAFNYTIYGRIPPLQDVKSGSYSDSIVVTVTY
jgi:spore coat protein U-like protein